MIISTPLTAHPTFQLSIVSVLQLTHFVKVSALVVESIGGDTLVYSLPEM